MSNVKRVRTNAIGVAAIAAVAALAGGATIAATANTGDDGREPGTEPGAPIDQAPVYLGDVGEFDTDSGLPHETTEVVEAPELRTVEARSAAIPAAPTDQDEVPGDAAQRRAPAVDAPAFLPGESGSDDQDG